MRADRIVLAFFFFSLTTLARAEKNATTFVPTREWQTVKKGTPIPKGLHVRYNFQTGTTEAKLLDSEEEVEDKNSDGSKSLTLHPEKAIPQTEEDEQTKVKAWLKKSELLTDSIKELKARLKNIEQEETEVFVQDAAKNKEKFRDYETLKKELKALEVNITTDSELLANHFQKFETHRTAVTLGTLTSLDTEEVLDILYNLEYLLHHIDNAKVFTDMQGMTKIISPCLNGTNNEIKAEALRLLGTAVQSNPKVQIKALENDFVQKLLHILSTNNKIEVKSRCLFALSALIRQFPTAQKVWLDHGGLEIFGKILVDDQLQVQMKVMKLINDLIVERQNLQDIADTEQREEKTRAYEMTQLEMKLVLHEYCKHLSDLITKNFKEELGDQLKNKNYEFLEVISDSMITVAPICKSKFVSNSVLSILRHLFNFYQNFVPENEQDEDDILLNLTVLVEKLSTAASEIPHDEL